MPRQPECEVAIGSVRDQAFGAASTAEEVTEGLDLTGKIALVTGCTAGIGYEILRVLVLRGARVYGAARDLLKAQRACAAVSAPPAKGTAVPVVCDHANLESVRACGQAMARIDAPLDMVVCNAGVYHIERLEQVHGLEKHFVVNHLSHFILVNWLIDRVCRAPQGRIVVVGSDAYKMTPASGIEFDNLTGQRHYDAAAMYGQSKLANGLFVRELARRLASTASTANIVHPGVVLTPTLLEVLRAKGRDPRDVKNPKTPEQGAATPCYVATSPALYNVSGTYFEDCRQTVPGGYMCDDRLARELWSVSANLTRDYLSPHD